MNLVQYNPENSDPSFHHGEHHAIYPHLDTITTLADCPFPLETETFKVITFGTTGQASGTPGTGRFALVEYVKKCGHLSRDRIGFFEGVEDFNHCGTQFYGADYSIQSWQSRIEYFRGTLCPVCDVFEHCRWAHFHAGERPASRKKTLARFDLLMGANFLNWGDFVSREAFEKAIQSPEDKSLSLRA